MGLVTGTCFAETGNQVVCVDNDENKVKRMQRGEIPIYEPGLGALFERNTRQGRLKLTTDLDFGVGHADILFLALPTPPDKDGSADLSYILSVVEEISHLIKKYTIVINKSTVPVGTAEKVGGVLASRLPKERFDVVSNPEFLREGAAVEDFMKPDRVIIGVSSSRAQKVLQLLYEPFVRQGNPIIIMDERSAEMTKYAANAYLATRVSFMNEIANLCERVGADVDMVRKGVGSDTRIGKRFLFPGVGYGGSCFPKDIRALDNISKIYNYDFRILHSVMQVNEVQKHILVEKIIRFFGGKLEGRTLSVWGLAFKPNTDDIREAPSLHIIESLLGLGIQLQVYDPEAMENVRAVYGNALKYCSDPYEALIDSDALVIVTEWSAFRTPDFQAVKDLLRQPVIFDGRNLYDLEQMLENGFHYESIGRKTVN